jgi:hypothetical protein
MIAAVHQSIPIELDSGMTLRLSLRRRTSSRTRSPGKRIGRPQEEVGIHRVPLSHDVHDDLCPVQFFQLDVFL